MFIKTRHTAYVPSTSSNEEEAHRKPAKEGREGGREGEKKGREGEKGDQSDCSSRLDTRRMFLRPVTRRKKPIESLTEKGRREGEKDGR